MGEGEIVSINEELPDQDNVLNDEDSDDGTNAWELAFGQCGTVGLK